VASDMRWNPAQDSAAPTGTQEQMLLPIPPVSSGQPGEIEESLGLPAEFRSGLEVLARSQGVDLSVVLLAGFEALVHRYTGREDVLIGLASSVSGFSEDLAVRVDVSGDPSLREVLRRTRREPERIDSAERLESLARELEAERNLSDLPFNRVQFAWGPPRPARPLPFQRPDVSLAFHDLGEGALEARLTCREDRFERVRAARLLSHLRLLFDSAVADPDQRVSELPLTTPSERRDVVEAGNATDREFPETARLPELVDAQAERTPDAVAVVSEEGTLTYGELVSRANQLANFLIKRGVGPDVLVALCLERSLDMVVGLLGIAKAGAAYVPLDPAYPRERLAFMLEDSQAPIVLTHEALATAFPSESIERVLLDSDWETIAEESPDAPPTAATVENLAYVIYTSGSTGRPKGVPITQRALVNLLWSMKAEPGFTSQDVLLSVTTLSFDIAGLELYLPLICGGRVVLATRQTAADAIGLAEKIGDSGATVMQATPATWTLLLSGGWEGKPGLKILCGGEALPRELADALLARGSSVWNLYGPTETTIWSAIHRVGRGSGPVPIGRPIANTQMYVLDGLLRPLPVGVAGELAIGGIGVARGYRHLPDLTAKRFLPNPFRREPEARLYRTGDLARLRPDGEIEFLGRLDQQVKIRGFRIELGEIESILGQYPGVRAAAVTAREDSPGQKRLVAYVVPEATPPAPDLDDLRFSLREKLPEYMIPSAFLFLEALPLTPNGKLDRKALPDPEPARGETAESVPPRDETEEGLVRIWEKALDVHPIGIRDDFFELGGHSLIAARIFAQIDKVFGRSLAPTELFAAPTIERLAELVRGDSKETPQADPTRRRRGSRPRFRAFYRGLIQALPRLRGAVPPPTTLEDQADLDPPVATPKRGPIPEESRART
jgi:amino acid adenylation domain-containing protein